MGTEADKSADGAVKPSDASASVSAEMKQELQKIVMGIVPDVVSRTLKKSLTESLPALLKEMMPSAPADEKKPEDKSGPEGRSLKALETQLTELRQQLQKRDEEIKQERNRVIDQQTRGEVRDVLAGILGAESPHLPLVMDSLYDARKRFVKGEDGQTMVKFKPEYGTDEELLPLGNKDTLKRLTAELKHVMPTKTTTLPAVARRGSPAPQGQGTATNVLDTIFSSVAAQAAAADPTQK